MLFKFLSGKPRISRSRMELTPSAKCFFLKAAEGSSVCNTEPDKSKPTVLYRSQWGVVHPEALWSQPFASPWLHSASPSLAAVSLLLSNLRLHSPSQCEAIEKVYTHSHKNVYPITKKPLSLSSPWHSKAKVLPTDRTSERFEQSPAALSLGT